MKQRQYRTMIVTRPRPLTQAQIDAQWKKYETCPFIVEGRFSRDDLVTDDDQVYRIATIGFRYHEDVATRLYGATKAKAPKEWTATCALRKAIKTILRSGMHEKGSRGEPYKDGIRQGQDMPTAAVTHRWQDGEPNSYASFPSLTIHEGGIIRAVRPNYDDSPSVAWIQDHGLAKNLIDAIAIVPRPMHIPEAHVRARKQQEEQHG